MAIKENVLPLAQDSGSGYIRTVSSGGASQRTAFDTVKGAITADMDEAIADEVDAREAADNQLQTEIDGKVDKVTGKGLSTNDFTNALKTKLDGIEAGAEVNVIETVKVNGTALVPDANRAVNVPAPTVDSALSTTSENPVQNKVITGAVNDLKEEINDKPNWTVGSAEQLVSDEASATDVTPYTFRRSGGGLIPFNFTREELSKVVGGTVAWNQLAYDPTFTSASNWSARYGTVTVNNNIATVAITSEGTQRGLIAESAHASSVITGHRYLLGIDILSPITSTVSLTFQGVGTSGGNISVTANTWKRCETIYSNNEATLTRMAAYILSNLTTSQTLQYKNACVVDLTAMLGTTIADYIYSLETATAGSGIAKLREWGLFRDSYYSYDSGSLQSVCVGAHETTGFNQWDEEWENGAYYNATGLPYSDPNKIRNKNPIKVLPNTEYYCAYNGTATLSAWFFDASGTMIGTSSTAIHNRAFTTPQNTAYMNFATFNVNVTAYNNDICINISKTTGTPKNGDYVPYQKHTYALDGTKTLRGRFYLDSNNQLRADGDIYLPSGEVARNWNEITFDGSENWVASTSYPGNYYLGSAVPNSVYANTNAVSNFTNTFLTATSQLADNDRAIFIESGNSSGRTIDVKNSAMTSLANFKAWLASNPLKIAYKVETPTTETADPYTAVQITDSDGTEEFVDALVEAGTRDVAIPAGTETVYYEDMAGKLAELPPIPSAPSANGTYTLQAVVSSGAVTYQWTS